MSGVDREGSGVVSGEDFRVPDSNCGGSPKGHESLSPQWVPRVAVLVTTEVCGVCGEFPVSALLFPASGRGLGVYVWGRDD